MSRMTTKAQQAVLLALACGATVESAARRAGVTERTVYRYLADPAFRQRVHQARAEQMERTGGALSAASLPAVKTLVDLVQDMTAPPAVRRGAARDLLEMNLRYRETTDWETRLAALEERLAEPPPAAADQRPRRRSKPPTATAEASAPCPAASEVAASPEATVAAEEAPAALDAVPPVVESSAPAGNVLPDQARAAEPVALPPTGPPARTPPPGRGRAKAWLVRLEEHVDRAATDTASVDDGRTAFFAALGHVLAPFPQAKTAVGRWLDQPSGATTGSFEAALGATLAPFPDAQAAVEQWLNEDRDTC